MNDPRAPARQASAIGKPYGLTCEYEYCSTRRQFRYVFRRHGRYLGSTVDATKVIERIEKYARAI